MIRSVLKNKTYADEVIHSKQTDLQGNQKSHRNVAKDKQKSIY